MIVNAIILLLLASLSFFQQFGQRNYASTNFRIWHYKSLTVKNIKAFVPMIDSAIATYKKKLPESYTGRIEFVVVNTPKVFQIVTKSKAFNEADIREGKVYLIEDLFLTRKTEMRPAIHRVVARTLMPATIPPWLAEAYALYAGNDLKRFNAPAGVSTLLSFSDLGEEFNRARSAKDVKEAYAKVSATFQFLYEKLGGDEKINELLSLIHGGHTFEEALTKLTGEPFGSVEREWLGYMKTSAKG